MGCVADSLQLKLAHSAGLYLKKKKPKMKFVETGQLCHQIKSTNTCKSVHSQVHPFVRWSQTAQMQNLHQPLCNIPIRLIVQ